MQTSTEQAKHNQRLFKAISESSYTKLPGNPEKLLTEIHSLLQDKGADPSYVHRWWTLGEDKKELSSSLLEHAIHKYEEHNKQEKEVRQRFLKIIEWLLSAGANLKEELHLVARNAKDDSDELLALVVKYDVSRQNYFFWNDKDILEHTPYDKLANKTKLYEKYQYDRYFAPEPTSPPSPSASQKLSTQMTSAMLISKLSSLFHCGFHTGKVENTNSSTVELEERKTVKMD